MGGHPTGKDSVVSDGCKTRFEFCPLSTYDWNEDRRQPVAARPYNCIVQCSNCAGLCPSQAIAFPPLSMLKEMKDRRHDAGV